MRISIGLYAAMAGSLALMTAPALAATYHFSGHAAPVNSGAGNILNYVGRNSPLTFDLTTTAPLAANMSFASELSLAAFWEASGGSAESTIDANDSGAAITTLQFSTDASGDILKYNIDVHATNTELPGKYWDFQFANFDPGNVFERVELDTLQYNGVIHYRTLDSALICTNGCGNRSALGAFTIVPAPSGAVPEPASWTLMILGVGLAGTALRRARRNERTGAPCVTSAA